ncbi:MAG: hypothetical protein ACREQW_06395, partial [Candidatus Binatia bacterium]
VATVLGGTFVRTGEEVFQLQNGKVTFDRAVYPVFSDSLLGRRVLVDTRNAIPAGLKARIEGEMTDTSVITLTKDSGASEVGRKLLARLGYQVLPTHRPLVLHDMGVGIQVKGDWMVMEPETTGEKEQIWVFLLTKAPGAIPDSLRHYLSTKGVTLAPILMPASMNSPNPARGHESAALAAEPERLPGHPTGLVDSLLKSSQIAYTRDREVSVILREGIQLKIKVDRYWESAGKKFGLVFGKLSGELKKAVEGSAGLKLVEVDIKTLTPREIVARVLQGLGEDTIYTENRFVGANTGRLKESLVLEVRGFLARDGTLLLTDRALPRDVERFILNQGIEIAYF